MENSSLKVANERRSPVGAGMAGVALEFVSYGLPLLAIGAVMLALLQVVLAACFSLGSWHDDSGQFWKL